MVLLKGTRQMIKHYAPKMKGYALEENSVYRIMVTDNMEHIMVNSTYNNFYREKVNRLKKLTKHGISEIFVKLNIKHPSGFIEKRTIYTYAVARAALKVKFLFVC